MNETTRIRAAAATGLSDHPRSGAATIVFAWAAMLVSYLPFSAVNGALPSIGRDAHAGTADLQWVTDAFTVALVVAVLAGGWLGDRFGRRRVTLIGLALTVVCSVIGLIAGILATTGTSPSPAAIPLLWVGQGIGGIGGGLVMSATLPLIALTASTPAVRDRAITVWAAANVIGLGAGPFLTGASAAVAGWPALFVPTAVLALATLVVGALIAREARSPARPSLDVSGLVTGAEGTVLLVFGVIRGGADGWTDPVALGSLTAAVLLLVVFVVVELRGRQPILDPRLFRSGPFSAAGLAAAVALFTMVGVVFVISIALGRSGVDASGIALQLGCLFAGNVAASITAGPLLARIPGPVILIGGLVVAAAGSATLFILPSLTSPFGLAWRLVVIGIGCGFAVATAAAMAVRSVTRERSGMAGVANNTLRQVGGALGAAVVGAVFAAALGASTAATMSAALLGGVHAAAGLLVIVIIVIAALSALLTLTTTRRTS